MSDILKTAFLGNTIQSYIISLVTFLLGMALIALLQGIVLKRLQKWCTATETRIDDFLIHAIRKQAVPLFACIALLTSLHSLHFNDTVRIIIRGGGSFLITVLGVRFLLSVMSFFFQRYWESRESASEERHAYDVITVLLKVTAWSLAAILLLDNLGIKISALITGLGISGIAIAFAAQAILKDLFNYFTIFFDRPFEIGDYIEVGDSSGSVEHIGIKTTRLRALSGEQLIIANTDLTDSRVSNYKRMEQRRVTFTVGVAYETPIDKLKMLPALFKAAIGHFEDVTFDRAHFAKYGEFDLQFSIVYYVLHTNFVRYMDIQQEINLRIMESFRQEGISFAYPVRRVLMENEAHA